MTVPSNDRDHGSDDAFELLRATNPVSDPSRLRLPPHAPAGEQPDFGPAAAHSRRRYRGRLLWIAPLAVIGTASVAAAVITHRDAKNPLDVGCYAEAEPDADTAVVRAQDDGRSAVEACATLWRDGTLGDGSGRVPELVECVLPSGAIGVFPGEPEVCERLRATDGDEASGSATSTTTATDDPASVIRLRDALVELTRQADCLMPDDGRRAAEDELRRQRLKGWSVEVGPGAAGRGFDDERPCVSYAVEPDHRTVVLVPFPRQG